MSEWANRIEEQDTKAANAMVAFYDEKVEAIWRLITGSPPDFIKAISDKDDAALSGRFYQAIKNYTYHALICADAFSKLGNDASAASVHQRLENQLADIYLIATGDSAPFTGDVCAHIDRLAGKIMKEHSVRSSELN